MKVRTEDPNHPAGIMYIFLEESYLFQAPPPEMLCGSTKTLVALCSMQAVFCYGETKIRIAARTGINKLKHPHDHVIIKT
jgi:hypothetical protein